MLANQNSITDPEINKTKLSVFLNPNAAFKKVIFQGHDIQSQIVSKILCWE